MDDQLKQYLVNKFGTPDYEEEAKKQYEEQKIGPIAGALSALGQAYSGQAPNLSWMQQRNKDIYGQTIGATEDKRKQLVEEYMKNKYYEDLGAEKQLDRQLKEKQLQEQAAMRREDAARRKEEKQMMLDARAQEKEAAIEAKKEASQEKQKQSMNEVSDRYLNIKDNISKLKGLVEQTGGGSFLGPENKQMDQYITGIATDMAKLVDPSSVARETEVEGFKKMLFEPGVGTALGNRTSTLQSVLKNFEDMVDKRLDTAYKIRGIEKPEQVADVMQKGGGSPSNGAFDDKDRAAYDWAMKNIDNPKSKQILDALNKKSSSISKR